MASTIGKSDHDGSAAVDDASTGPLAAPATADHGAERRSDGTTSTRSATRQERPRADAQRAPAPAPRIAAGVELIGEFEDSGFKEPPYIARRGDGQVVQMPQLLFALADEIDDVSRPVRVAQNLSRRMERGVTAEMVEMLIDEQLRPLGIVAPADGAEPEELNKVDPLLALKFRTKVVPDRAVRAATTLFKPLFSPALLVPAVAAFVALDGWLFFVHGISQSIRNTIYQPALMLLLLVGVVIATAFHEIGHATACRYGGAKPGVMGVGIYIVWPAFYTDITDAYRLDKRGRLRTDLGGMYFNAIFALLAGGAYFATHFEPLLLLVVLQTFAIVQQSLPLLRLDGYYIISDLTGVPDILLRIRPLLASLIPGRPTPERVTELKRWVRIVVTTYVLVLVPLIAFMFLTMLINAPRVFATGWDSLTVHWDQIGPAFEHGRTAAGIAAATQMLVLALPAVGIVYSSARIGRRAGVGGWKWSAGHPARRALLVAATCAFAGLLAFLWWPNSDYRPIQRGERGTIMGAFGQIRAISTGRAALTIERERELNGAPTETGSTPVTTGSQQGGDGHQATGVPAGARQHGEGTATAGSGGAPGGPQARDASPNRSSTGQQAQPNAPAQTTTSPPDSSPPGQGQGGSGPGSSGSSAGLSSGSSAGSDSGGSPDSSSGGGTSGGATQQPKTGAAPYQPQSGATP